MFTKIIKRIVEYWALAKIINEYDKDIYEYGLEILLFSVLNITVIMITAIFTDKLLESLVLIALVVPLQSFGGGYHAKTHLWCFLIMYIGWWLVMSLIPYMTILSTVFISGISLIVIFMLAPISNENVNLSNNQRLKMKCLVRIITVSAVIMIIVMAWPIIGYKNLSSSLTIGMGAIALSMLIAQFKSNMGIFKET